MFRFTVLSINIATSYFLFFTSTCRLRLKCDGTRAETRFHLLAKRTSPFKSAGVSVQSTIGSRGVSISGSNAGYTMFWGSVKGTGYPLHSPVSHSLPLPCVTMCHHISTGLPFLSISPSLLCLSPLSPGEYLCPLTTYPHFYVYSSVHHNIFYEITNRCSYMQSILFHC